MVEAGKMRQIDSLAGKEFEELVARLILKLGFVIKSQSTGPDGGIDILAVASGDLVSGEYVIQCKRLSAKVGVGVIRELLGVVSAQRAIKGILITNSEVTESASKFASGNPIELVDGEKLGVLLAKHLGEVFGVEQEGMLLPLPVTRFAQFVISNFGQLRKVITEFEKMA